MALVRNFKCSVCGLDKLEIYNPEHICSDCGTKQKQLDREYFLRQKKFQPIEKRLEWLEEYIYDNQLDERLRKIEIDKITY